MRRGAKTGGGGSSAKAGRALPPKENAKQSSEDSDDSVPRTRKRKDPAKEMSCAKACREEVESLISEPPPKKAAQKQPE